MKVDRRGRRRRHRDLAAAAARWSGTLVGVALLGTIGPALTFLGEQAVLGAGHPGRDHPGRASRGRGCSDGWRDAWPPAAEPAARRVAARSPSGSSRTASGVLASCSCARVRRVRARRHATSSPSPTRFEITRDWRRGRPARAGPDADHRHRRDRPLRRLDDGPLRGRARRALARRSACRWRVAVAVALAGRRCGRRLNALLIARLGFPPLIVTLGTYSLFRGLAEGLTAAIDNYSGFPRASCSSAGLPRRRPARAVFVLVAAVARFWLLAAPHAIGRSLVAIGFSPEGARYAGIPVGAPARRSSTCSRGSRPAWPRSSTCAPRAGEGRRRHRLRADGDHRGRARRRRRSSADAARVLGTLLGLFAIASCRTACASPTSPRSWRAS